LDFRGNLLYCCFFFGAFVTDWMDAMLLEPGSKYGNNGHYIIEGIDYFAWYGG